MLQHGGVSSMYYVVEFYKMMQAVVILRRRVSVPTTLQDPELPLFS